MDDAVQVLLNQDPYNQKVRTIADQEVLFDREGFLWDPRQWTEEVAKALGKEVGLAELNETQWRVIRFLREYYFQNGRSPLNRQIKEGTGISLMEMETLFPGGIKYGARRLAGLPNPKSCS
jgi:tRNA 2-thiouridine synthesizing protein E